MLHFNESESPFKSLPGLVSANPDGLVIHAQSVRWFDDVYEISGTWDGPYRDGGGSIFIPIAYPGEPTRFRVVLTPGGIVLDDSGHVPGEVCYLAALTLKVEADTPESVDVEVPRRTCTTETPEDAQRRQVPSGLTVPAVTPERAARQARAARVATLRGALASKPIETMTNTELRTVVALLVEHVGLDVGAGR
jgi:hypothetical protein